MSQLRRPSSVDDLAIPTISQYRAPSIREATVTNEFAPAGRDFTQVGEDSSFTFGAGFLNTSPHSLVTQPGISGNPGSVPSHLYFNQGPPTAHTSALYSTARTPICSVSASDYLAVQPDLPFDQGPPTIPTFAPGTPAYPVSRYLAPNLPFNQQPPPVPASALYHAETIHPVSTSNRVLVQDLGEEFSPSQFARLDDPFMEWMTQSEIVFHTMDEVLENPTEGELHWSSRIKRAWNELDVRCDARELHIRLQTFTSMKPVVRFCKDLEQSAETEVSRPNDYRIPDLEGHDIVVICQTYYDFRKIADNHHLSNEEDLSFRFRSLVETVWSVRENHYHYETNLPLYLVALRKAILKRPSNICYPDGTVFMTVDLPSEIASNKLATWCSKFSLSTSLRYPAFFYEGKPKVLGEGQNQMVMDLTAAAAVNAILGINEPVFGAMQTGFSIRVFCCCATRKNDGILHYDIALCKTFFSLEPFNYLQIVSFLCKHRDWWEQNVLIPFKQKMQVRDAQQELVADMQLYRPWRAVDYSSRHQIPEGIDTPNPPRAASTGSSSSRTRSWSSKNRFNPLARLPRQLGTQPSFINNTYSQTHQHFYLYGAQNDSLVLDIRFHGALTEEALAIHTQQHGHFSSAAMIRLYLNSQPACPSEPGMATPALFY
ncbi:hypothetical protein VKT23_003462 [Stygiomarasmius scandens]|uniref:Uncharacterized protein n=1 Tax=Marasmiellus scandens TaxID=2682957 RepID=A0ABR1K1M1_9AGAR